MGVGWEFIAVTLVLLCAVESVYAVPKHEMSERVYNRTVSDLQLYVDQAKALPGFIPGTEPRYYIHPPGTMVHGTVIIIHGFRTSANRTRKMADYLFRDGFNAIAANQAGGGQIPQYWPATVLRESAGYTRARAVVANHPETRDIVALLSTPKTMAELLALGAQYSGTFLRRLETALNGTQFNATRAALEVLKSGLGQESATKEVRQYFESEHLRHDAKAFELAQLGDSLPGPRFILGFSLGGAYTTMAASRSGDVERAVLLAPSYGRDSTEVRKDYGVFFSFIASLDLFPPGSSAFSAAAIAANLAGRDSITQRMREQTQSLCVIANDDVAIDVPGSLEVCRSKIGARTILYPKEFGIGHDITPDAGNPYGKALMRQIASFFVTGMVNDTQFLVPDNSTMGM